MEEHRPDDQPQLVTPALVAESRTEAQDRSQEDPTITSPLGGGPNDTDRSEKDGCENGNAKEDKLQQNMEEEEEEEEAAATPQGGGTELVPVTGAVEDMEVTVAQQVENLNVVSGFEAVASGHTNTHTGAELLPRVLLQLRDSVCDGEESSSSSDSDSSSSSSCVTLAAVLGQADDDDDDEGFSQGKKSIPIKTLDEVLPEELPAVEEMTIILPENAELQPIGTVSSIIEQLVIIQSLKGTPPLRDDSVIFNSDRLAMGKVFEVFGPVCSPFYVLRFNSKDHITEKGLSLNQTMFYTPTITDYTDYIFVEQLKYLKGSDASWKNDQEPPPEAVEFSDDEDEQMAKRKKNKKKTLKRAQRVDSNQSNQPSQPNAGFHGQTPNPERFLQQGPPPQRENWGPPPQHAGGNFYKQPGPPRHPNRHQYQHQPQYQPQHQHQYQPQYQHQYQHQPPHHFLPPPCPYPSTFGDYSAPLMGVPWPTQPYHTLPFSHLPPPPPPPPPPASPHHPQ